MGRLRSEDSLRGCRGDKAKERSGSLRRAVEEVGNARTQLYPSFLPLEVLPPVWVVKEGEDTLGLGGPQTPHVVGLQ